VSAIEELLAGNRAFAASLEPEHRDSAPTRRVAVVTCMDARLDVYAALGLKTGEAHVLRNAGGVISDDVIRSLAISQRRLGTREVMVVHHTRCGMQTLTDDEFRGELLRETGMSPPFAVDSFTDLEADVRQSLRRVRSSPFLAHRDLVRGFIYDVDSHMLREIEAGSDIEQKETR
jgi:carbonic anhydrase